MREIGTPLAGRARGPRGLTGRSLATGKRSVAAIDRDELPFSNSELARSPPRVALSRGMTFDLFTAPEESNGEAYCVKRSRFA